MTCQTIDFEIATARNVSRPITTSLLEWVQHRLALAQDRREVRRLLDLDSRLLDDMGLERYDISCALSAPGDTLPSHRIQALREQRACDRRSQLRRRDRH